MFTAFVDKYFENVDGTRLRYVEGTCLSTDELPTEGIVNGSKVMVMNNSTLYMFDAENKMWLPWT